MAPSASCGGSSMSEHSHERDQELLAPLAVGQPITLDQMITIWFDAKTERTRSHETERAYRDRMAEFRAVLQQAGLDLDGDPRRVASLAQGWADHTDRADATGTPIPI